MGIVHSSHLAVSCGAFPQPDILTSRIHIIRNVASILKFNLVKTALFSFDDYAGFLLD